MKKIVVSLCLLYAANSCAMGAGRKLAAVVLGTTPVTISAIAFYPVCENNPDEHPGIGDEEYEKRTEKKFADDSRTFEKFYGDAILGIIPVINMCHYVQMNCLENASIAEKTGFYGALSVYLTVPAAYKALALLKKAK